MVVLTLDFKEIFNDLKNQKGTKDIFNKLCGLKSKLLVIDICQLQRLIDKTNASKGKMKDKDIIFFIGTTGSGKSTNILKFLGYTLKQGKIKGLNTLVPVEKLQYAHLTFDTSPEA